MKRIFALGFIVISLITGCATNPPFQFPGESPEFEGYATWFATDRVLLIAGHANLPPGTRVRVTNLLNNRVVIVTITHSIPPSSEQIIEVSAEAAKNIGMNAKGSTPVKLEALKGRHNLDLNKPLTNTAQN
ncbi:hypothetical protein AGMMS49928_19140 [Spirochaetia bacterium]|nr:hypothetical protein AGMMS49928_19140 [Spirochaetia bacterium]